MKFTALSLVFLFSSSLWSATKLDANDVTILHDLPNVNEPLSFMMGAADRGSKGVLLERRWLDQVGNLVTSHIEVPADEYKALRVVGVRIDPCFKFLNAKECSPQMRLIWQPVKKTAQGATTFDAGLHTFHALNKTSFQELTRELEELKNKLARLGVKTNGPLNIHPAFKQTRTRSLFSSELKRLVLKYAGEKNLVRVTFMRLFTENIWWVFGGLEINNGVGESMLVTRYNKLTDQNFFNDAFNQPMGIRGSIVPELEKATDKDNLTDVLHGYASTFSVKNRPALQKALVTIDRLDNPHIFNSENMDCVHCHVATPAKAWIKHHAPEVARQHRTHSGTYQGKNLTNTSASLNNVKSLRMFGFFGDQSAISQRVINETAEVLKLLNK